MKKHVTHLLNIISFCSKFNCFKEVCVYIHKTYCIGIEKRPEVYKYQILAIFLKVVGLYVISISVTCLKIIFIIFTVTSYYVCYRKKIVGVFLRKHI